MKLAREDKRNKDVEPLKEIKTQKEYFNDPVLGPPAPWLDTRATEETMDHLWNNINHSVPGDRIKKKLAGNILKSYFIQDKDNWLYENVLKSMVEYLWLRESWSHYFDIAVAKQRPVPEFRLHELWVNFQKQHEFNPPHFHEAAYSFVVFMKIPTHWKEQHALPMNVDSNAPCASDFQFLMGQGDQNPVRTITFPLGPEDKGRMLFFPSWLVHAVYPFYGTEEERITVSGNIYLQESTQHKAERLLYGKDSFQTQK